MYVITTVALKSGYCSTVSDLVNYSYPAITCLATWGSGNKLNIQDSSTSVNLLDLIANGCQCAYPASCLESLLTEESQLVSSLTPRDVYQAVCLAGSVRWLL